MRKKKFNINQKYNGFLFCPQHFLYKKINYERTYSLL